MLAGIEELELWVAASFFPSEDTGRTQQQTYPAFRQTSSNGIDTKGEHKVGVFVAASDVLKDSSERHGIICFGRTRNRDDRRWVVRDHLCGLSGDTVRLEMCHYGCRRWTGKCGQTQRSSRRCPTYCLCGRHPGFMRSLVAFIAPARDLWMPTVESDAVLLSSNSCHIADFGRVEGRLRFFECLRHEVSMRHIEQQKKMTTLRFFRSPTGTGHWSRQWSGYGPRGNAEWPFDGPCSHTAGGS